MPDHPYCVPARVNLPERVKDIQARRSRAWLDALGIKARQLILYIGSQLHFDALVRSQHFQLPPARDLFTLSVDGQRSGLDHRFQLPLHMVNRHQRVVRVCLPLMKVMHGIGVHFEVVVFVKAFALKVIYERFHLRNVFEVYTKAYRNMRTRRKRLLYIADYHVVSALLVPGADPLFIVDFARTIQRDLKEAYLVRT
jgi:hypothetical protein